MPNTMERSVQEFCRATRMLAVIGASLKLRHNPDAPRAIRELIDAGADLALGDGEFALRDAELDALLVSVEMAFAEGAELLRYPDRGAAWKVEDVQLLQAMTRASSSAFTRILGLAESRPHLAQTLRGRFLDVGTGGGGIALKAAETCPDLVIDAIDLWPPALALAERNFAASPFAERLHLYDLDVTAVEPGPRYTLAWLPSMFLSRSMLERAATRIRAASRAGAYLVAAVYTLPDDPFLRIMSQLRTLRSGGEVTEPAEVVALLRAQGYVDIEVEVAPVATFVFGRLP